MKRIILVLAMLAGCANAPSTEIDDGTGTPTVVSDLIAASAASDKAIWPSSVPLNYVITPNGFMHPSCLVQLNVGESKDIVDGKSVIRHVDGSTTEVSPCAHPSFDKLGTLYPAGVQIHPSQTNLAIAAKKSGGGTVAQPNLSNGYVFSSVVSAASDVGYLRGSFYVPGGSTAGYGAIQFFIFNGIEGIHDVYQPLLANHGDSSWSFQNSMYEDGTGYFGPAYSMTTGDLVRSAISHLTTGPHSETISHWTGATWAIYGSSQFTGIDTSDSGAILAAGETYYVSSCSQYPYPVALGESFNNYLYCLGAGCVSHAGAPPTPSTGCPTECNTTCTGSSSTATWQWHQ